MPRNPAGGLAWWDIEIDPLFVDLAIRRWQAFTGEKATRESDGATFDSLPSSYVERGGIVMRGRRPTPTRIKVLTGNPDKRPLNPHEPRPELALPECPAELSPLARQEWERLSAELAKLDLVTHLDRCLSCVLRCVRAMGGSDGTVQKFGTMVKSPTGYPIQSPYLAIANRQAEIMLRVASEFGFTPASRSRISTPVVNELPLLQLRMDEYGEEPGGGG